MRLRLSVLLVFAGLTAFAQKYTGPRRSPLEARQLT